MSRARILLLATALVLASLVFGCSTCSNLDGADTDIGGECGDNLKWTYSDGKLAISGTGAMTNYSSSNKAPWNSYRGSITSVVVGSGITTIGSYAFDDCTKMTSLELPSSLKTIGSYSFDSCSGLTELTIPPAVSSIDSTAFSGCTGVTSLRYQTGLCNDFKQDTTPFSSLGSSKGMAVNLMNGINRIPAYLLCGNANVTSIDIPDSIKTYGAYCLKGCTGISSIVISYNATEVETGAFSGCTGINKVYYYSKSTTDFNSNTSPLASISSNGFGLEVGGRVTYAPAYLAYGNTSLTSVTFSSSVLKIGSYAFIGCTALEEISIPSGLTSIGTNAFNGCTNVQKINFNAKAFSDVTQSPFVDAYNSKGNTTISIGSSVQKIPAYMFCDCKNYVFDAIPSSVTSIGGHAFANTGSTIDLTKASKLTQIDEYSFSGAGIKWTIPSTFKTIPRYAFYKTTGTLSLEDGSVLETIGERAFADSKAISAITIPATVNSIGKEAFSNCSNLLEITYCTDMISSFDDGSDIFDGVGDGKARFIFSNSIVPARALTETAFTEIVINDEVRTIGSYAFKNVDSKTIISGFGSESKIQSIGIGAFAGSPIKNLYLNDALQEVGVGAFSDCHLLADVYYSAKDSTVTFGSALTSAGPSQGFKLHVEDDVKTIPANAFANANVYEVILNNVETIGSEAFRGTPIESLEIPASVKEIGELAFAYNESLTRITFLSGETEIGKNAFIVEKEYLDTNIECYRKAVQNDYHWTDDSRDPHFTYVHLKGEYDGMMEVLFNLASPILGYDLTNEIIDFFIDAYSLKAIEAVDMGSEQSNQALLVLIAILLLAILFVSLYFDKDETVRLVEIALAFATIAVLVFSIIRRVWTSPDYMDWAALITFFILFGIYAPVRATYDGLTAKRMPYYGEHLVKLYTQDTQEFIGSLCAPWAILKDVVGGCAHKASCALLILSIPGGLLLSAIYSVSLLIYHIPAMIFSKILVSIFVKNDQNAGKHTNCQVCPTCGNRFLKPVYICDECGTRHEDLAPGAYGIHVCTCECGNKIPCTIKGERWKHSDSRCPSCDSYLETEESEPFSFAMVGAPGSGKTTIIAHAVDGFMHDVCPSNGIETRVIGLHDIESLIADADSGTMRPTDRGFKPPYSVVFQSLSGSRAFRTPKALYFFDCSGDEFVHGEDRDTFDEGYRGLEGIVFAIDPLDIPEYAIARGEMPKDGFAPDEILASFSRLYTDIAGIGPMEKIDVPIAIVVTRCRGVGLEQSRFSDLTQGVGTENIIRFFEEYGQYNFTNEISTRFTRARYFAVDSNDDCNNQYMIPFAWLMDMANPGLEKIVRWSEAEQ